MSTVGQIYRECQQCDRRLNIGEDLVCDDCAEEQATYRNQAAEILELRRRNENQAETIIRLREELEMYK